MASADLPQLARSCRGVTPVLTVGFAQVVRRLSSESPTGYWTKPLLVNRTYWPTFDLLFSERISFNELLTCNERHFKRERPTINHRYLSTRWSIPYAVPKPGLMHEKLHPGKQVRVNSLLFIKLQHPGAKERTDTELMASRKIINARSSLPYLCF